MRRRPEWQSRAACLDVDIEVFFRMRTKAGQPTSDIHAEARAICAGCEVREECFNFGLRQTHGVWGGFSDGERYNIRTGRRKWPTFGCAA